MKKEIITPYSDIRDSLKTFDIVNCIYGTQKYNPIHWFLGAIGHSAQVYRCQETGQVMIYESTQTGRADKQTGVQLRPMKEWVANYPGKIYIRKTIISSDILRTMAEGLLAEHIKKYRGTEYPDLTSWRWRWFLANAAIDLPWKTGLQNPDIDYVMFCTHLLVHAFRFCQLISIHVNPAEFEPDDLRRYIQKFKRFLPRSVTVGEEIRIK